MGFFAWAAASVSWTCSLTWDGMWLAGVHRGWAAVPELSYTSQCIFMIYLLFLFKFYIWEFSWLWLPATETSLSARDPTAASPNLPSRWAWLSYCSSPRHRHIPTGSVGLGGFAGDQSMAACAWPALGLVLWKVLLGNPIPPASCHILLPQQHSQGPCPISQLLSSRSPLLAPNMAPPHCQVSTLLPRTFTQWWHQAPSRLRGNKYPNKHCNTSWYHGGKKRDHKAACNAVALSSTDSHTKQAAFPSTLQKMQS